MVSYGGSRNNLTLVLPEREKTDALKALQKSLFNNEEPNRVAMPNQSFFAN
jgi:hypothetical protein